MSNIFEYLFTEEGTGVGKSIFEGVFKFSVSETRNKFDSTDSVAYIEEERYASTSTQEYQKMEGKLDHDSIGGRSGAIGL